MKAWSSRWVLFLLMLGVIAGSAFATGGGETEPAGAAPARVAAEPVTMDFGGKTGVVTVDFDESKYGGTLTFYRTTQATNFFMPKVWQVVGSIFPASQACETLGRYDENYQTIPWLAEELVFDPDAGTLTITVPEGVLFHDGSELTGEVVKWNIEQYVNAGGFGAVLGNPDRITVPEPYTCVVHMTEYRNNVLDRYGEIWIISQQAYEENGGEEYYADHLVGTGPFIMDKFELGVDVTFSRNPNYRIAGLPFLDGLNIIYFTDFVAGNAAFSAGELELIQTSPGFAKQFIDDPRADAKGLDTDGLIGAQSQDILFNSLDPTLSNGDPNPFYDVRVRQAVYHAIDRQTIVETTDAPAGVAMIDQVVPVGVWSASPDVQGYDYDPARARQLLAAAGYPNGFSTTMTCSSSFSGDAVKIQGYLAEVGIEMELEVVQWSVMFERYVEGWDNMIFVAMPTDPDCSVTFARAFLDGGNFSGSILKPADIVALTQTAVSTSSFEEKQDALQEINRLMTDEYALHCPIYFGPNWFVAKNGVMDHGINEVTRYQWTPELMWYQD